MLKEKQRLKFEKDQIQLENKREADRDDMAEYSLLYNSLEEADIMFDKQLFYYNASITILMLYSLSKVAEHSLERPYYFLARIFPLIAIIFCGLSFAMLMMSYRHTTKALQYQMHYVYNKDDNIPIESDKLRKKSDGNVDLSWRLFVIGAIIAFIYISIGIFNLDFTKKDENFNVKIINGIMQNSSNQNAAKPQGQFIKIESIRPPSPSQLKQQALQQQASTLPPKK